VAIWSRRTINLGAVIFSELDTSAKYFQFKSQALPSGDSHFKEGSNLISLRKTKQQSKP
jgi:hypothetical protein